MTSGKLFNEFIIFLRTLKWLFVSWRVHKFLGFPTKIMAYWVYFLDFSQWCERNNKDDIFVQSPFELYQLVVENEELVGPVDYLEFGVAYGTTLKWWIEHNSDDGSRFFGFDTFTGLPEDWGLAKKGLFSTNGTKPEIDDARCSFVIGLYQNTLGNWLETVTLKRKMIVHLDSDLYSSTIFALTKIAPHLKTGDILIFDEFNYPLDEYRAFKHFTEATGFSYEFLGATTNFLQVAIKIVIPQEYKYS